MNSNEVMNIEAAPPRRRMVLALGRGKSGKTLWVRWLIEMMRARGVNPVVLDADTDEVGLSRYEEGAARPREFGDGEETWWWTAVLEGGSGCPVVADCSHNTGVIDRVHSEAFDFHGLDVRDRYAEIGFDVTKVCFFAPDVDDAEAFMTNGARVTATDTLLVLNEGVGDGRRGSHQFDGVRAHPAVREAIEHGAGVAWMPALRSNLAADREIRSLIAFSKLGVEGQEPLVFKRLAMRMWLEKMETAFTPFNRELGLV
jgi:hypothetical protein